jgi:hypothetical protein
MKKALLVLLLLAVAGGLFAQEGLTFSSGVQANYRIRGQEDAYGRGTWTTGSMGTAFYAFIAVDYENADGTKGGSIELDSGDNLLSDSAVYVGTAYGWFTMFDGILKINGGNWAEGEFNEGYWAAPLWGGGAYGLAAYVYPIENLSVGAGIMNENIFGASAPMGDMVYWFGAAYEFDGGGVQTQLAFGENYGLNVHLSGSYGFTGVTFYGLFRFEGLTDPEKTRIRLNEVNVLTLVKNFRFEVPLSGDFNLGSKSNGFSVGATAYYTPGPWFWPAFAITYNNTTFVTPTAANKNVSTLSLNPFVRVGLGRTSTYLQVGYTLLLDLVENGAKPQNNIDFNFRWRF